MSDPEMHDNPDMIGENPLQRAGLFALRFKTGEPVRDSEDAGTMLVKGKPCAVCGQAEEVEVDVAGYRRWRNGELIQDALRGLPMDKRELLISGTHSACWDRLWSQRGD